MKINVYFQIVMLFLVTVLSGCAHTRSSYVEHNKIARSPKSIDEVEYFAIRPKRAAIGLGILKVGGNAFSDHKKVIKDAKMKAAELGGDFILEEDSGTEKVTSVIPAYSSYQSSGSAYVTGNRNYISGSAYDSATAFSVGPSIQTDYLPWAVFSVGVYKPSSFGLDIDKDSIITGFNLNSDAELAGVKRFDRIIGIDGIDINDERFIQHAMEIQPGDKILLSVLRDGQRLDYTITALPN